MLCRSDVDAAPGPQFVVLAALIDPAANIWPPGAVLRDDRAKCGMCGCSQTRAVGALAVSVNAVYLLESEASDPKLGAPRAY